MSETDWSTKKDSSQVIKAVYDVPTNSINTNIVGGNITISAADDSIKIGDGTDFLAVNTDGSLNVLVQNAGIPVKYDYFVATYPNDTTEIFTYKTGGSSGTIVSTVTIVYTDNTKQNISTFTRV